MEEQLHREFIELQHKGVKIKGWWLKSRAKQILNSIDPDNTFKCLLGWFTHFKARYNISLRRPTNIAQKPLDEKEVAIQEFHKQIRKVQDPGDGNGPQEDRFKLYQIANVDQKGPTYDTRNSSTV